MDPGGVMRLVARRQGRRIVQVEVDNPRPQAARVLVGRTVDEALRLVPTLFSLCSHAQRIAATAACVAAGATQTARPEAWMDSAQVAR